MPANESYIFTLEVRDAPGILVRAAEIFGRRAANISQIHTTYLPDHSLSQMTITASNITRLDQITRQLEKLIDVHSVTVTSAS